MEPAVELLLLVTSWRNNSKVVFCAAVLLTIATEWDIKFVVKYDDRLKTSDGDTTIFPSSWNFLRFLPKKESSLILSRRWFRNFQIWFNIFLYVQYIGNVYEKIVLMFFWKFATFITLRGLIYNYIVQAKEKTEELKKKEKKEVKAWWCSDSFRLSGRGMHENFTRLWCFSDRTNLWLS